MAQPGNYRGILQELFGEKYDEAWRYSELIFGSIGEQRLSQATTVLLSRSYGRENTMSPGGIRSNSDVSIGRVWLSLTTTMVFCRSYGGKAQELFNSAQGFLNRQNSVTKSAIYWIRIDILDYTCSLTRCSLSGYPHIRLDPLQ